MSVDWESRFRLWAKPPSTTEEQRIQNAISVIRRALAQNRFLDEKTEIFIQGSHKNRVNVRQNSDVDIAILYIGNTFYAEYPNGMTKEDFGHIDGEYGYDNFKDRVEKALVNYFGQSSVERGNKAFEIHENTYRINADVVPVFEYRKYYERDHYVCGVLLNPDKGGSIINWPEQHYENGVKKNGDTSRSYKGVVRILKNLKYSMSESGIGIADDIPGFWIECMVWNVPNSQFASSLIVNRVDQVLNYLQDKTRSLDDCKEWMEVSNLKSLFRGLPSEKLEKCHEFLTEALGYIK